MRFPSAVFFFSYFNLLVPVHADRHLAVLPLVLAIFSNSIPFSTVFNKAFNPWTVNHGPRWGC
jgi:hypothetical protein